MTHKPTHIIGEKSFYIDLIFASQPNIKMELCFQSISTLKESSSNSVSKVQSQSSLPTQLHTRVKFDIWKKHNRKTVISMVSNRKNHFENMNVSDMVHLFNKTIKNILLHMEQLHVMTKIPWRLIQEENEPYKRFKSSQHFENFQSLRVY